MMMMMIYGDSQCLLMAATGISKLVMNYYCVTTCLENLEMSGILTAVGNIRDFTRSEESVRDKILSGKVAKYCLLLVAYLRPFGYLVASS